MAGWAEAQAAPTEELHNPDMVQDPDTGVQAMEDQDTEVDMAEDQDMEVDMAEDRATVATAEAQVMEVPVTEAAILCNSSTPDPKEADSERAEWPWVWVEGCLEA